MAEIEYISYSDIQNVLFEGGEEVKREQIALTESKIDSLLNMCNVILLNINNQFNEEQQKQGYISGMQFIYQLRRFLLNEAIDVQMGVYDYKSQKLDQRIIPQENYLNALKVDLANDALKLDKQMLGFYKQSTLEQLKNAKNVSNPEQDYLWKKIRTAAWYTWVNGTLPTTTIKGHKAYQKKDVDNRVYVTFSGKSRRMVKYYLYNDFKQFNYGWLYEQFLKMMETPYLAKLEHFKSQINGAHPILPLMIGFKQDNVPGQKGGDLYTKTGQAIQAKYNNWQISSLTNITNTLNTIRMALNSYRTLYKNPQYLKNQFLDIFTDNSGKINKSYDEVLDTILGPLNKI